MSGQITNEQARIIGREIGKAIADAAVSEFRTLARDGVFGVWVAAFGKSLGKTLASEASIGLNGLRHSGTITAWVARLGQAIGEASK